MSNIGLILLAFAFVFACFAAWGKNLGNVQTGWLSIACWVAAELIGGLAAHFR